MSSGVGKGRNTTLSEFGDDGDGYDFNDTDYRDTDTRFVYGSLNGELSEEPGFKNILESDVNVVIDLKGEVGWHRDLEPEELEEAISQASEYIDQKGLNAEGFSFNSREATEWRYIIDAVWRGLDDDHRGREGTENSHPQPTFENAEYSIDKFQQGFLSNKDRYIATFASWGWIENREPIGITNVDKNVLYHSDKAPGDEFVLQKQRENNPRNASVDRKVEVPGEELARALNEDKHIERLLELDEGPDINPDSAKAAKKMRRTY